MQQAPTRPPEAVDTPRARLRELLTGAALTSRELSEQAGLAEKDVVHHLAHIEKSLAARGEKLHVEPPRCLSCNFAFTERARLTRPSRCPQCRSNRITPPRFRLGTL